MRNGLEELLAVWRKHDELVAAGHRPIPEQIEPGDWIWWWSTREAQERPLSRILLRDDGYYLVAYRGQYCEWGWAWVPFRAITAHVPAGAVRRDARPNHQRGKGETR